MNHSILNTCSFHYNPSRTRKKQLKDKQIVKIIVYLICKYGTLRRQWLILVLQENQKLTLPLGFSESRFLSCKKLKSCFAQADTYVLQCTSVMASSFHLIYKLKPLLVIRKCSRDVLNPTKIYTFIVWNFLWTTRKTMSF